MQKLRGDQVRDTTNRWNPDDTTARTVATAVVSRRVRYAVPS